MLFGECRDLYLGNFVVKCIVGPDYWGKISTATHSSKKKNKTKIKCVTLTAKQCPRCLEGLLHLIENKYYQEIVVNIPIYTSGS